MDMICDAIALAKTWLDQHHPSIDFFPQGFHVFRADQVYSDGLFKRVGGSAIAAKVCQKTGFGADFRSGLD